VIRLAQICKRYPRARAASLALEDVDLEVSPGEFVAVMGPSGCGKTTLLNIVGLIDVPSAGRYWLGTRELERCSPAELTELRRRHIGFIFQSFQLIDDLTVFENVELALRYRGTARVRRRTLVREALELVSLETRAKAFPDELSGGERQRIAVARALVHTPELLLADEPTGHLDKRAEAEVLDLLETLNGIGTTVLMVTHSLECASRAGRVVRLCGGRVVNTDQRS
jgi:putative ABC transport system ATP-binding protein